jgi:hypothetical protein
MGYRDYSTAKGHIVDAGGTGDFKTIASALTAASSGQTIFIRPGTYTENLTLKAGVNLSAYVADATTPNVTIVGKCTFTAAGTVSISGINLQTNSDYALAVTGSAASIIYLTNCYLNCSNNTGITFTSSSSSALIVFTTSFGNLGTTGIGYFTSSSAGTLGFNYCSMGNTGNSTTASSISAGSFNCTGSELFFPISASAGSLVFNNCGINTIAVNTACVTTSSTGSAAFHQSCALASGTASALSVGTGTTVNAYDTLEVSSSNTNALNGLGTIQFGLIVYTGSSSTNNVSTQTKYTTQPAIPASFGVVVQQKRVSKTAAQTVTSTIAAFTTQPTTSTGTSVVSLSITPTNSSSILLIEGNLVFTSGGNFVCAYLIQNATGNGFGSAWQSAGAANYPMTIPIRYYMTAGTTSAITFDLYTTVQAGGNVYVNANTSAAQLSNGTAFTSLMVTEFTS